MTSISLKKKSMLNYCITYCLLFGLHMAGTVTAQVKTDNPLKNRQDSLVHAAALHYFRDAAAVGLSIGISKNGKTSFYNYGEKEAGAGNLPDSTTIYEIGSITKTFTGILLAQAAEDKKVNLNDDVRKYLKEPYPNLAFKGMPVTLVSLANHTSRIGRMFPNFFNRPPYDTLNPYASYTPKQFNEGLHKTRIDTFPGVIEAYSNMGSCLLGNALENAYGKNYFELISRFVLKPLKMNDTRIDLTGVPPASMARAHNAGKEPVPYWDFPEMPAFGSLRSNAVDMMKYVNANINEATPAIALSHQSTFGNAQRGMGLGWVMASMPAGGKIYWHTGGTGGSRSELLFSPELKTGFVILANGLAKQNGLEKDLMIITLRDGAGK